MSASKFDGRATENRSLRRLSVICVGLDYSLLGCAHYDVIEAEGANGVLHYVHNENISVFVIGPSVSSTTAKTLLLQIYSVASKGAPLSIVVGNGHRLEAFRSFIEAGHIFYMSCYPLPESQLQLIVEAANNRFEYEALVDNAETQYDVLSSNCLLEFCDRLVIQEDLTTAGDLIENFARRALNASSAQYLNYDANRAVLWAPPKGSREGRTESAATGVTSFVARTGKPIRLSDLTDDPRYDAEADSPSGTGDGCVMVEPVLTSTGTVCGLISVTRDQRAGQFSEADSQFLSLLALCAAPTLNQFLVRKKLQASSYETKQTSDVFREEALQYHAKMRDKRGELLKKQPQWLRASHWLGVALIVASCAFAVSVKTHEYATGPSIVRLLNKHSIHIANNATIWSVESIAGKRVRAGDVLMSFKSSTDSVGPVDRLMAPMDGLVVNVAVRAGSRVESGDEVLTMVKEPVAYELIALLPGSNAPQLQPGMSMVFTLPGFRDSHVTLAIHDIDGRVMSSRDAEKYSGLETSALATNDTVVVARAGLSSGTFISDGYVYSYRDGMSGTSAVRLRSKPIIESLLPGVRQVFRNRDYH